MRLYPAIDILGGRAVRLRKGDFGASTVYERDPAAAARGWADAGARALHVVDLDGARRGEPVNLGQLQRIARAAGVPVQYGGGLRSADAVAAAMQAGAERVVLGTAALADPQLLERVLGEHGAERVLVAVDVRGGHVATHGWLRTSETRARDAFAQLREAGVRRFVFTDIEQDGTLAGANLREAVEVARAAADGSVIYSGGIGSLEDLQELADLRARERLGALAGVIVGTALYEGRFTIAEAQQALGD